MTWGVNVGQLLRLATVRVEGGWCQGVAARDDAGEPVPPALGSARCFCVLGSLERARRELGLPIELEDMAERMLRLVTGAPSLPSWNDDGHRTAAEVVKALRDAALRTESPDGRAFMGLTDTSSGEAPRA